MPSTWLAAVMARPSFSSIPPASVLNAYTDYRVLLWDLHQEDVLTPCARLNGPEVTDPKTFSLNFKITERRSWE
jgi:hypothetical protein